MNNRLFILHHLYLLQVPADRDADLITKDLVAFVEYFLAKWKPTSNEDNNNAFAFVEMVTNLEWS